MQAELDALPAAIERATEDGDDKLLASLLVRDRIITRKLEHTKGKRREEQIAHLNRERDRLVAEFEAAVDGIPELELGTKCRSGAPRKLSSTRR